MTNGEKMQEMFPEGKTRRCRGGVVFESDGWCHDYDSDWWNTEHKEPTAKCKDKITMPYATPDNCGNYIEQTTTNDLGVDYIINGLDDFIEFGKKAFGVELTIKKSDSPDTYAKLFGTTKNDLGVDCISRAEALGAIRNLYPSMPRVDFSGSLRKWVDKYKPYIECDDAIKELPSVTPQEPRWIPVEERLPEDGQRVLFCDIDNDIMIGYHIKGRPNTHFSQDGTYEDMKNVRAWMPLPKSYSEVEK